MPKRDDREEFIKRHPNVTAREMPNSYEAETAVIGCMLIDGQTAIKYLPQLTSDDFYTPAHKFLLEAMRVLFAATRPIDLVTTVGQLETDGTLELSGGVDYVSNLVNAVPSIANAEYYFNIVKKNSKLRALIEIAQKTADAAYALDPDDTALTDAEAALYALAETGKRAKPEKLSGFIDQALKDLNKRASDRDAYRGVPTGFPFFDMKLGGGFQNSDLIILAARPGQGKTSFAMNCAVNAAKSLRPDTRKPYSVAVFSLEMSAVQLARRILCSEGNFSMTDANRAAMDEFGWQKLFAAQRRLENAGLYIDESGDVTPAEILSKCRALKRTVGLDFVMIDYLQLMQSGKRVDNIVREIAEMTRALKLAAKELDVPILLLSQMSRGIEQRKDPRPQLSDLRDSGAIEQDADIVLFLDRKEEDKQNEDGAGEQTVYLNIAKHRNGETGNIKLTWLPATVTFKSEPAPEPPAGYRRSVAKSSGGNGENGNKRKGVKDESPAPPPIINEMPSDATAPDIDDDVDVF